MKNTMTNHEKKHGRKENAGLLVTLFPCFSKPHFHFTLSTVNNVAGPG